MPVHIEDLVSEVAVWDGDLALSDKQLEAIARKVLQRLDGLEGNERRHLGLTAVRRRAQPPSRA